MSSPLPTPYTVLEAAAILREDVKTVRLRCKSGAIKAHKPADRYLIWPEDLRAYIEGRDSQDVA